MQKLKRKRNLLLCLFVCFVTTLAWLHMIIPQPENIILTTSDLTSQENSSSTIGFQKPDEGMFWIDFKTSPRLLALNKVYIKTRECISSLATNHREIPLPQETSLLCNNSDGIRLEGVHDLLATTTQWFVSGFRSNSSFGLVIDVDWREWPLAIALLGILSLSLVFTHTVFKFQSSTEAAFILFLSGAALALRWWFVFCFSPPEAFIFSDMAAYLERGWEMKNGIYQESHLFQPPGFTLFSSWMRTLGGWQLYNWSQVILSWGTVLLIYQIARENLSRSIGTVAFLIATFHMPLISVATLHYAENSYAFLITVALLFLMRALKSPSMKLFFLTGITFSLAFYFKGNHAYFMPLFCLWYLYQNRADFRHAFRNTVSLTFGFFFVCSLHAVWSAKHYGKPSLGPTAGALNFVEGKCPSKDNMDSTGSRWLSPMFIATGELTFKEWPRPFTDQAYFWKEGLKCIQENPMVLIESLRYIYFLFGGNTLWPIMDLPQGEYFQLWSSTYALFITFALLGVLLSRSQKIWSELSSLLVLSLFLTVWFFKSEYRFRVPFDGIFILWASMGIVWVYEFILSAVKQAQRVYSRVLR